MRLTGKDKKLNKKWRPILRGWLKELSPMDMDFPVELMPETEIELDVRGQFQTWGNLIVLPVGSNDIQEIKHCFFHEIKHLLQLRNGTLSIFASPSIMRREEKEACRFAVKYAPCQSEYISDVLKAHGIK